MEKLKYKTITKYKNYIKKNINTESSALIKAFKAYKSIIQHSPAKSYPFVLL